MKRLLSVVIVLALAVTMVACDLSSEGELKEPSQVEIGGSNGPSQAATGNNKEPSQDVPGNNGEELQVTISETVLLDEAGVKITAKSIDTEAFFGTEVKLLIENNTGKDLTFQCRNASVNGYMVEPMMSVDVAAGKKANDSMTFMNSDLEACGINEIADMEFSFHIFYTEDWETYLDTERIQLKTSIADTYQYTYDDSGELAYEENGIKIVIKGLAEDASILGPSIVVYIENTSDENITVQARDLSINGFMIEAIFSCDVTAGKRAVDTITLMESDLEENEISSIEDVELSFHIFDSNTWETIVDTEVVKITF